MKVKLIFMSLMVSSSVGSAYWLGKKHSLPLAVVDVQKIVSQTAEALAGKNLTPEQTQRQISHFKETLRVSLKEFAQQKNLYIVPTHSLFGALPDQTENFITFYNEGVSS